MSERASRRLFLIWLIVCLPSLAAMATYAAFFSGGALVVIGNAALSIDEPYDVLILAMVTVGALFVLALMLGALNGLYRFVQLAFAFMRLGSRALQQRKRLVTSGLATGAPAFLLWTVMTTAMTFTEEWPFAAILGGGPLTLSVLHLWLELRRRSPAA